MYYFIFSATAVSEYGASSEAFAVGYVVLRGDGTQYTEGRFACDPRGDLMTLEEWRAVNEDIPSMPYLCTDRVDVRNRFWSVLSRWVRNGAAVFAENGFPVAVHLVRQCVEDDRENRDEDAPMPIHDVSTLALQIGREPLAQWDRWHGEEPKNDPLCDARHAARKLVEYMALNVEAEIGG